MKKISVYTVLIVINNDCECDTMDEKSFNNYDDAHDCFLEYREQMLNDMLELKQGIKILTNNADHFSFCNADNEKVVEVLKIIVTTIEIDE